MEVPALKDETREHPIASSWRPVLKEVVTALAQGDFQLSSGVPGVVPIAPETATQMEDYLADYGETLVELPDDTWATSVAQWMGTHWEVLVDLWTAGEGASDLVLGARVHESANGHVVELQMIYVP